VIIIYVSALSIGETRYHSEHYLGLQRWLIRGIGARKVLDFSSTRLSVHTFDVALFPHLKRRIHKDLEQ